MTAAKEPHIVMPTFDTKLKFECQKCGACCSFGLKRLKIIPLELYPMEAVRLYRLGYGSEFKRIEDRFFLRMDERGVCPFLTRDKLCGLRLETSWTPVNCRLFPFTLYTGNGIHILTVNWEYAARVGCKGFGYGPTIAERMSEYEKIAWEVDQLLEARKL